MDYKMMWDQLKEALEANAECVTLKMQEHSGTREEYEQLAGQDTGLSIAIEQMATLEELFS